MMNIMKFTTTTIAAAINAVFLTILLLTATTIPIVTSNDTKTIPATKTEVDTWFINNVKAGSAEIDPQLVIAETGAPKVIKVMKDGSGDFKTVSDAIKSIPTGNTKRVIVSIGAGEYNEKVTIERTKPFITLYGAPGSMPTLVYAGTALTYGTVDSATLIAEGDYFSAANIIFSNSAPAPDGVRKGAQAAAMRISGDKAAFYNCRFIGFQDTLCDDKGRHFFMNCYIEGTVDFIFGSGKSLYLMTELHIPIESGLTVITAQARDSATEDNGYSFVHCSITGTSTTTFLGRPWKTSPQVVYAYTDMGSVVSPQGWTDSNHPELDKTVFFGEYKNSGASANSKSRVTYAKQLSDSEVKPFTSLDFIEGSKWLLPPPKV